MTAIVIGGIVVALVVQLGGGSGKSYLVPTSGMSPTITPDSTVQVDLNAYRDAGPRRGDIVLFPRRSRQPRRAARAARAAPRRSSSG